MANQFLLFHKPLGVLLCLLSLAGAACGSPAGENRWNVDPYEDPEFLTPVAEAAQDGVRAYWLGEEFEAEGVTVQISGDVARSGWGDPLGIRFLYGGSGPDRSEEVRITTFSREGGGASGQLGAVLENPGAVEREVRVGSWEGSVVLAPSATRPVNHAYVYVEIGDMDVLVVAMSGTTGVPGTDVSRLIDGDLLIEVVAENLRPYPE